MKHELAPGDYALMHANGTPFAEIVRLIREEAKREHEEFAPVVIDEE